MVDSSQLDKLDSAGESELQYEAVEPWAIVALLLGLVAPVALLAPVLWLEPILGILAAAAALVKISHAPGRTGRWLALLGLALAAFFLAAAVAQTVSAQWLLARQARSVADTFVELLHEGSPEKALMLNRSPEDRYPIDEGLWSYYQRNEEARNELKKLVDHPAVRMIAALGDRAQVRYYKAAGVGIDNDVAQVDLWYTITFTDSDNRKKTYILGVLMERQPIDDPDLNPWRVKNFAGGIDSDGR
jgi:hypothetical protein